MPDASFRTFWATVAADAQVENYTLDPKSPLMVRLFILRRALRHRPGFACVFWLRVNQLLVQRRWRGAFRLRIWRHYRFASDISEYAQIGPGLMLPHPVDVTVGSASVIGKNVSLYNGVTLGSKYQGGPAEMPRLGNGVIVYTGAKIIGPVVIGDNSEIGALALCTKDVPPESVMYGMPPAITIKPKKRT